MMPNAAVCAVCMGAALLMLARGVRRAAVAPLGIFVALVGGARLYELTTGQNLGIDRLILARDWGQRATTAPGRMGPPASLSWILLGLAVVLSGGGGRAQRASVVGAVLATILALLSLVGFSFGADMLYLLPKISAISIQTASILFALSVGLIVLLPERSPMKIVRASSTAGMLARRVLPLVIVFPIFLGWLRLRGQQAGLYDTSFGAALHTLIQVIFLVGLLWWALEKIEQKETALNQEKSRAAHTLESITDGYHVVDADARFTFFNDAARKMYAAQGINADLLIGKQIAEDAFPDAKDLSPVKALLRCLAERVPTVAEDFYPRWQRWFTVRHYPTPEGGAATFLADVTERKKIEGALRDSESQLRAATSAGAVGTWNWDLTSDRLTANPALLRIFGLPAEDGGLSSEAFIAAILPDDQPAVRTAIARALASEADGVYEVEYRVRDEHAIVHWVLARGQVEYDDQGKPVRLPGALTDITERKQIEEQLRRSADLLNVIVESSPTGFYIVDSEFRISHVNADSQARAFRNVVPAIGRPLDEAMRILWPEPLASEIIAIFRHTLHTGEPYRSPGLVSERRDLQKIETYEWQIDRITMPDGSLSVLCYFFDTTALREAELALRESEERFRTMADNISQLAWTCEELGEATWYNQRWLDYTGMSLEDLRPDWAKVHHPDHLDQVMRSIKHSAKTGAPWEDTFPLRGKDGNYRWFLSRAVPIRDAGGRIVRWFGTNTDITALREAEEAMRTAREQAEQASHAKDEFLAQLSHELRTPLTPVLMLASALRDDERLPADIRDDLAMMERHIALEARLIDDLLDLTRITSGKLALRSESCDVHSLIEVAVGIVRDEAREKEITFNLELRAERSQLLADPTRLQQVFWNLLRNAVKFTPRGGHIRVTSHDGPCESHPEACSTRRVCISVSDNGVGFTAAEADRLFEPFHQAAPTQGTGLGLGLAIARAVVDLHSGTIRAESAGPGCGATFTIELPGDTPAESAVVASSHAQTGEPGRDLPLRLLLVEDHEATRQVLARTLSRAGHAVTDVGSIVAAKEAAREQSFDFVISDLGLPDGTGHELMAALRDSHGLQGIALSGYGAAEDLRRSGEAGFAAHLVKPVDVHELHRVILEMGRSVCANAPDERDPRWKSVPP